MWIGKRDNPPLDPEKVNPWGERKSEWKLRS